MSSIFRKIAGSGNRAPASNPAPAAAPSAPNDYENTYAWQPDGRYDTPEPADKQPNNPSGRTTPPIHRRYKPSANRLNENNYQRVPTPIQDQQPPPQAQQPQPPVQQYQPPVQQPPSKSYSERALSPVQELQPAKGPSNERAISPIQDLQPPPKKPANERASSPVFRKTTREFSVGPDKKQTMNEHRAVGPDQRFVGTNQERGVGPNRRRPEGVQERSVGPDQRPRGYSERASSPLADKPQSVKVVYQERGVSPNRTRMQNSQERAVGPDQKRRQVSERASSPLQEKQKPTRMVYQERGASPLANDAPMQVRQAQYYSTPPVAVPARSPSPPVAPPVRRQPQYYSDPPIVVPRRPPSAKPMARRVPEYQTMPSVIVHGRPPSPPDPPPQPRRVPQFQTAPPVVVPGRPPSPPPPAPQPRRVPQFQTAPPVAVPARPQSAAAQPPPPPPAPNQRPMSAKLPPPDKRSARWCVVVDLKGTVPQYATKSDNKPEVIEISIVLINGTTRRIEPDQFHAFVRPTLKPKITEECMQFNRGIRQYYIDQADEWPTVNTKAEKWLSKYNIEKENNFTLLADGSYDMENFMKAQCGISQMPVPAWATQWVNLRKDFKQSFGCQDPLEKLNVYRMLEIAQLKYEGKKYDGRDECFNLALIAVNMMRKGYNFTAVEMIR